MGEIEQSRKSDQAKTDTDLQSLMAKIDEVEFKSSNIVRNQDLLEDANNRVREQMSEINRMISESKESMIVKLQTNMD